MTLMIREPATVGVDAKRLARLPAAIQKDIDAGTYDGCVVIVARHGEVVLHETLGKTDLTTGRTAREDDVFAIMSLSKSMATTLVLMAYERGDIQLTTPVANIIPEFAQKGKQRITIAQVLGHTAGLGGMLSVPLEVLGNLEATVKAMCSLGPATVPGKQVSYSPLASQSILAEVVRRLDSAKRPYRQIMQEDLFDPLGMVDSSLGQRVDLESRRVPIVTRDTHESRIKPGQYESFNRLLAPGSEMPAAGVYSTARDTYRFAEMLRRGGELDGVRLLSPLTIELATRNFTGQLPNTDSRAFMREVRGWDEWPAFLGLGFYLRGEGIFPCYHGSLASPGTYGHAGAGSAMFWVDPVRDMSFVGLTAGLLEESYSIERWQKLSDLALMSIVGD